MILKINIILRSPFNVLHSVLVLGRQRIDQKRKKGWWRGRRERIEKGSRERIEIERKEKN